MPSHPKYKRILLKLSGESLMGNTSYGIDLETVKRICNEIKDLHIKGVEISLVIGAGNIFRGITETAKGIERTSADYMGMLATIMNALAVQSVFEGIGVASRVQSAIPMVTVCEAYVKKRAIRHLEKGRIVIFAGGTGNPFFTTDTAAALRALEMNCDALLKGTQVDGIYDKDPQKFLEAKRFDQLSYQEVLSKNLRVMDTSAIALARENKIPIIVFSIHDPGCLSKVVFEKGIFSIIR
ncbi:MAG: UMP kinase [Pseudomonadota bacterium]|nr:UMP kinase [Pseudomonadota bacterium]